MKKFLVSVICALCACSAFAAGENVATSKAFVDAGVAQKQDKLSANAGAPQVLTNTGTAGTVGTKDIYTSSAAYSAQSDSLIDAQTMNTAVQNAIDAEFKCVQYNPNDSNDCWLVDVLGQTETQSKNVFDPSQLLNAPGWTENNGVYTGRMSDLRRMDYQGGYMDACVSGCKANTRYTLSYTITNGLDAPNNAIPYFYIVYTDGTNSVPGNGPVQPGETKYMVFTTPANKTLKSIRATYNHSGKVSISNIQIEEGTVATPYHPYGNVYLPSNN